MLQDDSEDLLGDDLYQTLAFRSESSRKREMRPIDRGRVKEEGTCHIDSHWESTN